MFDAPGDDVHFAGGEGNGLVAEFQGHFAIQNDEDFVGVGVGMPDEFALDLGELELVVVHLGDDAGRPVFGESGQLVPQIDRGV